MKKLLTVLLSAALIAGLLAGPSGAAEPAEAVKISLLNSKPEITEALEAAAADYAAQTGVTITVYETDSPGDYLTTAYASGDPTTLALVDYANIRDFCGEYFLDLSGEKWAADGGNASGASFGGCLYGFPFAVEGRGLLYNKTAIENTLGAAFDPADYTTVEAFSALLADLRDKGMDNSVVINAEDWSIGSHYLQNMYGRCDGTMAGSYALADGLKDGSIKLQDVDGFNDAFDALDVMMEYNYNKADPLAADYDLNAANCADGTVAFWLNGTFAWPDFSVFAQDSCEYGIMPIPTGENSPCKGKLGVLSGKFIAIDKSAATEQEQQAAKDFLNWLVYTAEGNDLLVNKCGIVPAFANITLEMSNPFNADLQRYIVSGDTAAVFTDLPSDHRSALGGQMQKYIAGQITREDLADTLNAYWRDHA